MQTFTFIEMLEETLDALCKATSRDIFVVLPKGKEARIVYLVKEIKNTLDRIDPKRESVKVFTPKVAR